MAYNNEKYQYGGENLEYSITQEEYELISGAITPLYMYTVDVALDPGITTEGYINSNYDDHIINVMVIEVNGKEYTFDIGEIRFDNKTKT